MTVLLCVKTFEAGGQKQMFEGPIAVGLQQLAPASEVFEMQQSEEHNSQINYTQKQTKSKQQEQASPEQRGVSFVVSQ